MAVLLTCDSIAKAFGSRTVFSGISLGLHDGDRLGVIGPNGAGKSTFLQILRGAIPPDAGAISARKGLRMPMVVQDPEFDPADIVKDIVAAAAPESDEKEVEVAKLISRAGFPDGAACAGTLSGGWRKRLAITAALAAKPDVLLLDEPTNHLDIEGILWLEKLLNSAPFASIFVTHDRYFLEDCSTRVAEINRIYPSGIFSASGSYSRFLEKRSEFIEAQAKEQQALRSLVERELEWLRRGAKARTTKSKARLQDATELQAQLAQVAERNRTGVATIDFTATGRAAKRLVACESVAKSMGGRLLFRDLKFALGPGSRLGILGANGSGKSTLLRILAGEIEPDAGEVRRAEGLRMAWFRQNRDNIGPDEPLRRALAPEGEAVNFRGRPIHVAGWAARFLFQPEQLDLPVARLSGGERARVQIARLMLQPADILMLDEPTNDLDIPTLDVLENNLADFPGAIVLVTHDRFMLDRLSTLLLALDGRGGAEFYAELAQWEQAPRKAPVSDTAPPPAKREPKPQKRLSYLEARELEQIEGRLEQAEAELAARRSELERPDVVTNPERLTRLANEIQAAEQAVEALYARWGELESRKN